MTWPREHDVCVFAVRSTSSGVQASWDWVQPQVDHDTVIALLRKAVAKEALRVAAECAGLGTLEVHVRWHIEFRETVPGRIVEALATDRLVYGIELVPSPAGSPTAAPHLLLEAARAEIDRASGL